LIFDFFIGYGFDFFFFLNSSWSSDIFKMMVVKEDLIGFLSTFEVLGQFPLFMPNVL